MTDTLLQVRPMTAIRTIFVLAMMLASSAGAEEALWTARVVHFDYPWTNAYDAWVIHPVTQQMPASKGDETPRPFADLLTTIQSKSMPSRISHIGLGWLCLREDIQSEVIAYVQKHQSSRTSPWPFGTGRWHRDTEGEMKKLVVDGLLQSKFVRSLNRSLAPHRQKIVSVSMEKLVFDKKDGKIVWDAMINLHVATSA